MNYEDIILLVKAGYTRDQIAAMQAPAAQPAAQEPTKPATPQEPQEPSKPASAEPTQPRPQGIEDLSQMLSAEFAKLNDAIVKANLQQAQQPPQESVDDILASIINPPQKTSGTPFLFKEVKS